MNELKNLVQDIKTDGEKINNTEVITSFQIILKELNKIRDILYPSKTFIEKKTFDREIKTQTESEVYNILNMTPVPFLPEITGVTENYVYMPIYNKLDKPNNIQIIQIIRAVKNIYELGYSHRAVHPNHIMLDKDKNIRLVDFGKSVKIGQKSNLYSYRTSFLSRNAMLQNNSVVLDDIESIFYCLLFWFSDLQFFTYSSKTKYIDSAVYTGDMSNEINKFLNYIRKNEPSHDKYIKIFK